MAGYACYAGSSGQCRGGHLIDDKLFFDRLAGMHLDEQEELVRRRIAECLNDLVACSGLRHIAIQATVTRLRAELHRIAQIQNRARWSDAIRNVFGQEGYEAVRLELERMTGFPYGDENQRRKERR